MEIDLIATVISPEILTHIEAFRGDALVGQLIRGDLLRLRWDDGELELVARRAMWSFSSRFDAPAMLDPLPAELVPLLQRGATGFRQRVVRAGDRLRVRGVVERQEWPEATLFFARGSIRLDEAPPRFD